MPKNMQGHLLGAGGVIACHSFNKMNLTLKAELC